MPEIDVLGSFWALISHLIKPFADFLINFLPNGDPQVFEIIDSIGSIGAHNTFNVFYFVDWGAVLVCFGVVVTVSLIIPIINTIIRAIDMAHKAVESIPVVE